MDYYDEVAMLHGVRDALAIAVRDARQLANYVTLIRLVTAIAVVVDMVREGIKPPADATPNFAIGWQALFNTVRESYAGVLYSPREAVLMIADRQLSPRRADLHIQRAKALRDILEHGFAPPESSSDDYRNGWQKAHSALVTSDRFQLLVDCIADAVDVFGDPSGGQQQRLGEGDSSC
jgi:hypothetical protein